MFFQRSFQILCIFSSTLFVGPLFGTDARDTNKSLSHATEKYDVVVIGAGVAGLTVARYLKAFNYKVCVLEGNNRIGGRIVTDREMFGVPINLGASWIHGDSNEIFTVAQKLNLKIPQTKRDATRLFKKNNSKHRAIPFSEEDYETALQVIRDFHENISPQVDQSVSYVVREFMQNKHLDTLGKLCIRGYIAHRVSGLHGLSEEKLSSSVLRVPPSESDYFMLDGYDRIVEKSSEGLTVDKDILLNHMVTHIDYSGEGGVKVTVDEGNVFKARYAVCTVPLGVLKKKMITFLPELPEEKSDAIHRLEMGVLNHIVLEFPEVFWHTSENSDGDNDVPHWICIAYESKKPMPSLFFNYNVYDSTKPILICEVAGDLALELEDKSDSEVVEEVMNSLKSMFGPDIQHPKKTYMTRWAKNKFSYGSYSSTPVTMLQNDYETLQNPLRDSAHNERVFFAGEAMSEVGRSTVHGAYDSGLLAGGVIHDLMKASAGNLVPEEAPSIIKHNEDVLYKQRMQEATVDTEVQGRAVVLEDERLASEKLHEKVQEIRKLLKARNVQKLQENVTASVRVVEPEKVAVVIQKKNPLKPVVQPAPKQEDMRDIVKNLNALITQAPGVVKRAKAAEKIVAGFNEAHYNTYQASFWERLALECSQDSDCKELVEKLQSWGGVSGVLGSGLKNLFDGFKKNGITFAD